LHDEATAQALKELKSEEAQRIKDEKLAVISIVPTA